MSSLPFYRKLFLFALGMLGFQAVFIYFLNQQGAEFPATPPFFYAYDRFMDFFNVNFYASQATRYTRWKSVYSPFNFLIAQIFSGPAELYKTRIHFAEDPGALWVIARYFACGLAGLVFLFWQCLKSVPKSFFDQALLFLFLFLNLPLLFCIDRGNYILFSLLFLVLYFGARRRYETLSLLFFAAAISMKLYLGPLLFLFLPDWKKALKITGFALLLNLGAAFVMNDFTFTFIIKNLSDFYGSVNLAELLFSSIGFSNLLVIPSQSTDLISIYHLVMIPAIAFTFFGLIKKVKEIDQKLVIGCTILLAFSPRSYLYNLILLLPFFPVLLQMNSRFEKWRMLALIIAMCPWNYIALITGHLGPPNEAYPAVVTEQALITPLALLVFIFISVIEIRGKKRLSVEP